MASLSFRSSRVIYYGPHPCQNCGVSICRAGHDYGGSSFTYPSGPIYPNTEWSPHFCNPLDVRDQRGREARESVIADWPLAVPIKWSEGFVISADGNVGPIISCNMTTYDSPWAAWSGALERKQRGYPSWVLPQ